MVKVARFLDGAMTLCIISMIVVLGIKVLLF